MSVACFAILPEDPKVVQCWLVSILESPSREIMTNPKRKYCGASR